MDDMTIEEIREQITRLIEKKEDLLKEKQVLENTDILKRYFDIDEDLKNVDKEIKKKEKEETLFRYSQCDHELLFLETYCLRRKNYQPKFKCIECGKRIMGALNQSQIVINEHYTDFDERTYIGDLKDYKKLCKLYSEYKEQGLGTMQIAILLEGSLYEKYHEIKSILKLVRK